MIKYTILSFVWITALSSYGCGSKSSGGDQGNVPNLTEAVVINTPEETAAAIANSARLVNTPADLPKCDSTTQGLLFYVLTLKQFQVCQSTVWTAIDLTGAKGATGTAGTNGAASTSADSERLNCYRQANNQLLGISVDGCYNILFSDGIRASFDLVGRPQPYLSGAINVTQSNTPSIPTGPSSLLLSCGYKTSNCNSDCYVSLMKNYHDLMVSSGVTYNMSTGLPKDIAIRSAGNWFRTTGLESDEGQTSLISYIDTAGACINQSWTSPATIKVTTTWTSPVPLPIPLGYIYLKKD